MILPRISRRPFAFGAWLVRTLFWGVATMAAASTWADDASHRQLWTIPAVGGEPRLLADSPGYDCGSPDWSPDGKWIAYDNWQIGKGIPDVDVVVIRSDGTDRQVLGHGAMPSWSPDGKQLVCHTYQDSGAIIVMNRDGSGREAIIDHWGSPRWSPRGNRIAAVSRQGTIALFDCATGVERTIFSGPYSLIQGFSISPDGVRFCFSDPQRGLGLATLDEKTMQASVRWLVKNGECFHSSWSPDGKRVVFQWVPTGQELDQLYLLDVDSQNPPVLLSGQNPGHKNVNPDWSPDGETIVFASEPAN